MPLRIEIAPQGTSAENVEQEVFVISKPDKMRLLDSLLDKYKQEKVLIFSRTKHGAKKIARNIRDLNHTATEIHSNRSQNQRIASLKGFTNDEFRIMVATDIAARGIDVKDIGLVINYDLPDNSGDYVHRIGRTGRAGKFGKAISFVTPTEKADIRKIEKLIRKTLPVLSLPILPAQKTPAPQQQQSQNPIQRQSNNRGYGNHSYGRNRKRSSRDHQILQSGRPVLQNTGSTA